MKTNKLWSIMMLTLVIGTFVIFSSCGDDEPPVTKCECNGDCHGTKCSAPCADDCKCTHINEAYDIIGRWKAPTFENEHLEITFYNNGKGQYCVYYKNVLSYDLDFTYVYDNKKGSITISFDDDPEPWVWSVKFNNANSIHITIPYDDEVEEYTFTKQ